MDIFAKFYSEFEGLDYEEGFKKLYGEETKDVKKEESETYKDLKEWFGF